MSKRMSGGSESIAMRLDSLNTQLNYDKVRFLGSVIDLEDSISEQMPTEYNDAVTIEEFADDEGFLLDRNISENVWLASIQKETRIDCRMIVDFQPPKELGLFRWLVVCCVDGKPIEYSIKVWIVPPPK